MSGAKLDEKFCNNDEREEDEKEYAELDGERINTSQEEDDSFDLLDGTAGRVSRELLLKSRSRKRKEVCSAPDTSNNKRKKSDGETVVGSTTKKKKMKDVDGVTMKSSAS